MEMHCGHCGYEWTTKSTAKRISCSRCKTSIRVHPPPPSEPVAIPIKDPEIPTWESSNTPNNKQLTEVKFPPSLWKDARLSQRFMALANMGEEYVILKVNDEGILSL